MAGEESGKKYMKVKAISTGSYIDENNQLRHIEKSMIVEVSDEELLGLKGYAATNHIYDKCERAWNIMALTREYEIVEEGLAKDIPYLDRPFESVEEMRNFLKKPEVIAEFEGAVEV